MDSDTKRHLADVVERARTERAETAERSMARWAKTQPHMPVTDTARATVGVVMDEIATRIAWQVEMTRGVVGQAIILVEYTPEAQRIRWEARKDPRAESVEARARLALAVEHVDCPDGVRVEVSEVMRIHEDRADGGDPHTTGVVVTVESPAATEDRWIIARFEAPKPAPVRTPKVRTEHGRAADDPMAEPFVETTVDTLDGPVAVRSLRQTEGLTIVCDTALRVNPTQARAMGEKLIAYADTHSDSCDDRHPACTSRRA